MATGAELRVIGWFVSPIIKSVVGKAQNYLSGNYKLQKEAQEMIQTLTDKLPLCELTAMVAEEMMLNDQPTALTTWLTNLKDAAYDADDLLDKMEARTIKEQVQGENEVSKVISYVLKVLFTDADLSMLKKVSDRVKQNSDDIRNFAHLVDMHKKSKSNEHKQRDPRDTRSQTRAGMVLYGREDELKTILQMILPLEYSHDHQVKEEEIFEKKGHNSNSNGPFVLPVVGIGGVGKTALARAVYNHDKVKGKFEKAWVYVSPNHDVDMLMRILIQTFGEPLSPNAVMTSDYISNNMSSVIRGRRFLIVLDNMSKKNEDSWEELYNSLKEGASDSVILITTQNKTFANKVATNNIPFVLNELERKKFWKLFKSIALGKGEIPGVDRNNLKVYGRNIAGKLGGLPLAAEIIGTILRDNKHDLDEWKRISRSGWWDIPHESRNKIVPFLGVGYQYLDPYLRRCFAYCSLFPQNLLIDKDRLVQMWIAQNFISPDNTSNNRKMEDIGRKWFEELVERSVFQPAAGDYKGYYIMPCLMHDLAVAVSSQECFYLDENSHEIPQGVRHLAVDINNPNAVVHIPKPKYIRSFLYFGLCNKDGMCSAIDRAISNLENIRVLDLSYLQMETKKPPSAIQKMPLLRFLDLSYTGIEKLTKLDLYHLQTLHIRQFKHYFISLPTDINKLINLRHLNAHPDTIAQIPRIGQLVNLQGLDEYRVGQREGHKIIELHSLGKITGHLSVTNCENIVSHEEAMQARLDLKNDIRTVELCWSSAERDYNKDEETLGVLKPHENTNKLTIKGYMGQSFPNWMSELGKLSTLEIVDNKALWKPPLHCFSQSLKALKIDGCPNLRSLGESLVYLTSLSLLHIIDYTMSISIDTNALKFLEDLTIKECPALVIKGDLQSLTNLEHLEIISCCPQILRDSITRRQKRKGKEIELQETEGLLSLSYLEIDQSLLQNDLHLIFGRLPSLRFLNLRKLLDFTMDQALWFEKLIVLQELTFWDSEFKRLPSSLTKLSTLKILKLVSCTNLEWYPGDGMPPSLQQLILEKCSPQFMRICKPDGVCFFSCTDGVISQLLSHVPLVRIDGRRITSAKTSGSAELLIGGWFATAVINRVVMKAMKYKSDSKLGPLISRLASYESLVSEERMIPKNSLWLRLLKELVYEAEDVLDNMEAGFIKKKFQRKNKVIEFASSCLEMIISVYQHLYQPGDQNPVISDDNHRRLKNVLDWMDKIPDELVKLNYVSVYLVKRYDEREANSQLSKRHELFGREDQLYEILDMILGPESAGSSKQKEKRNNNENQRLLVIPIVGVGKTAFAQGVYCQSIIRKKFDLRAWLSVPHNFDVRRVMQELVNSFGGRQDMKIDISKNLSSIIDGKKFLVVLDDISHNIENQWDNLKYTLSRVSRGVVLITTQNQAFAQRVGTVDPIVLNPLTHEEFWNLVKHISYPAVWKKEDFWNIVNRISSGSSDDEESQYVLRKMNCSLRLLPLEAKIFGKLLRYFHDNDYYNIMNEWNRLSFVIESESKILPCIIFAYQHLDPSLRQCFAYCSLFPRNSLIDKDSLVRMWIAQNFIPGDNPDEMEDIGREWFHALVDLCFLQPVGDHGGYAISSLMHDLAVVISSDECFYLTDQSWDFHPSIRHLSVNTKYLDVLKRIPKENCIRSFFYFGLPDVEGMYSTIIEEVLPKLNSLRVLDLSCLLTKSKKLPCFVTENMPQLKISIP